MEKLKTTLFTSLDEARNYTKENRNKGCFCPCCDQFVKVYKRKLSSSMSSRLIRMYKATIDLNRWLHFSEFIPGESADFQKLVYWGLIEKKPKEENSVKKSSGYWRITKEGVDFVKGSQVKKYIYLYDGELIGFSDESINIYESLGDKFNYKELMGDQNYDL